LATTVSATTETGTDELTTAYDKTGSPTENTTTDENEIGESTTKQNDNITTFSPDEDKSLNFSLTEIMLISIFAVFAGIILIEFLIAVCDGKVGVLRMNVFIVSMTSLALIGTLSYFTYGGTEDGHNEHETIELVIGLSLIAGVVVMGALLITMLFCFKR
jgi:hypothetical protein